MIKQPHSLLDCLKSSSPLNVSPPWLLKFSSCPLPGWWHKNHFPRGKDTMMWSAIFHIPYPIILYHSPNPSKWTIEWNYGHCREHFWFSFWKVSFWDNMRLKQKECVDLWLLATILHNLKIYIFVTSQTIRILEVHTSPLNKVRDVFLKTPLFGKKWNVILIWLGS